MSAISELNRAVDFPDQVADKFEQSLTPLGSLRLLALGLRIAPRQEALQLVDAFVAEQAAGYPLPSLEAALDDADWHAWASTPLERKAYCLAHFKAMRGDHQRAFLAFVSPQTQVAA